MNLFNFFRKKSITPATDTHSQEKDYQRTIYQDSLGLHHYIPNCETITGNIRALPDIDWRKGGLCKECIDRAKAERHQNRLQFEADMPKLVENMIAKVDEKNLPEDERIELITKVIFSMTLYIALLKMLDKD